MRKLQLFTLLLMFGLLAGCSDTITDAPLTDAIDLTDTSEDYTSDEIETLVEDGVTTISGDSINLDKYYEDYDLDLYKSLQGYDITTEGVYILSGTYDQTIVIDTEGDVDLILDNVIVSVNDGPAILVLNAEDVTITSLPGTDNLIEDTFVHSLDENLEDYNAAIYSTCDLIFNGTGSLTVNGNYNNAINSKDDIRIVETNLTVNSVDDGIIGRDYLAIKNATITVTSKGDSLLSTNDESTDKGFIYIESGTFNLTSNTDAIQAVNGVLIQGGDFEINADDDGIVSDTNIVIGNGSFVINAGDDAINATTDLTIYDGEITVDAGDDGLHSDETLHIEGGDILVSSSYEGVEAFEIYLNGGTVTVNAEDDGINATAGGGQMHGTGYVSTGGHLEVNGGIITVNAGSDGVDANGTIVVTDGYLIVFGSSENNQSPIDYDASMSVTGGVVLAVGSTGMIQAPSTGTDGLNSLLYADTTSYNAGTTITILDEEDNELISVTAVKSFTGLVYASEDLKTGSSYSLSLGSDTYDFTVDSVLTSLGDGGTTQMGPGGGIKPPGRP